MSCQPFRALLRSLRIQHDNALGLKPGGVIDANSVSVDAKVEGDLDAPIAEIADQEKEVQKMHLRLS